MPPKKLTKKWIDKALEDSSDDEAPTIAESKTIVKPGKKKRKGRTARKRIKRRIEEQREAQQNWKEMEIRQGHVQALMDSLSPEESERRGLGNLGLTHTTIQDDYTGEGRSTKPGMSYPVLLSHMESLPEGWQHGISRSHNTRGLSYWTGPVTYIDSGYLFSRPLIETRSIWDYPSKKRLEEEAKYLNLTRYKGKRITRAINTEKVNKLQRKWKSRLSDKIDQHQRDLEGESHIVMDEIKEYPKTIRVFGDDKRGYHQEMLKPIDKRSKQVTGHVEEGGKSFFEEGKAEPHQPQPSAIFTDSGADGTTKKIMKKELKVGGKRRKQKGGGDWLIMEDVPGEICTLCDKSLRRFLSKSETVYQLDCGHKFHSKCLSNYCKGLIADGMMGGWPCPVCGDRDEDIGDDCNTVTLYMDDPELLVPIPPVLENPNLYYRRQNGGKRTRRKRKKKTRRRKKTKRRRKKRTRRKKGGKTTVLGFPIPIFDLWQTKVKVNNTKKEVEQWKNFIEKKTKGGRRKKRTRRKRGGNKQLSDKQTFLKEVKKNEKKLKPMFTEFMNRFIISKKTITFNMVLKEIENMKDSEFEKNINNIINNKSRSKKGGVWLPDPTLHLTGDDNVDTYNCTLLAILIIFAASQILFLYELMTNRQGVRFGLQPAIDNMRDILGPILYFVNIFCRLWAVFHNHAPHLEPAGVRRQNNARDIMQQINHVEPMIIRQRLLEEAPDSVGTFDWQAMESFLNEVRQILEEFEIRYYAPADSTAGTKRGI